MKKILRVCPVFIAVLVLFVLAGCSYRIKQDDTQQEVVTLFNDRILPAKYMEAVKEFDHVIYEEVYIDHGSRSIGPTEYRYRGIAYLTEEEAGRLWNEYEWEEIEKPDFEFGKVDKESTGEGPWYNSTNFITDNYSSVTVSYTVFDGKKLVFDFRQM